MNSAVVALLGLTVFFLGYRFYSRIIGRKVFGIEEDFTTPAYALQDGKDFVPTRRYILFGHHYASIAGAAPILGPAIAMIWGWVPAVLWVVLGTVFIGAVHDFGSLVVLTFEAWILYEGAGVFLRHGRGPALEGAK